jgi:hypothetical protein
MPASKYVTIKDYDMCCSVHFLLFFAADSVLNFMHSKYTPITFLFNYGSNRLLWACLGVLTAIRKITSARNRVPNKILTEEFQNITLS